ncbi:glutathione S-transferase family protein [Phyllobacterium salinisoli]|uniref:glutathione transferase n=1 Tax=Phyllobacterium salinisoli TaxID=1899321 RepID=A0A368K621_9HYPH|nr:glutathione S-transferase family protein [Phyllobacterium salinisoli]RCS24836.1 glutathione S-transferase family protein [Phyllobacterium salinisoli]
MQAGSILYGATYSVYVRIVRLALMEKGVQYSLVPVDVFAPGGPPKDHLERHPFGRIPVFVHAGLTIYETSAITRYIDEAFDGPALQPVDAAQRARCNQLVSIADNYAYPNLVWGIYVELVSKLKRGELSDPIRVASALARSRTCLQAVDSLIGDNRWLAGPSLTLADLYVAPMFAYFLQASEGQALLSDYPRLSAWWSCMAQRTSMLNSEIEPTSASR